MGRPRNRRIDCANAGKFVCSQRVRTPTRSTFFLYVVSKYSDEIRDTGYNIASDAMGKLPVVTRDRGYTY